jgi:hypothetical protein
VVWTGLRRTVNQHAPVRSTRPSRRLPSTATRTGVVRSRRIESEPISASADRLPDRSDLGLVAAVAAATCVERALPEFHYAGETLIRVMKEPVTGLLVHLERVFHHRMAANWAGV